jgi:hypothetical protein
MREHRAVSNYTKGYKVLEYITSENIDLEDYKKYLAKNDSEFKYVLGEFELPYYIALYDFNIQSELLPRAKNFFAKREVYDRYLNKYKYTPEFQWIILNPNINDKGKDNQILVLLYKKHLDNVRKSFKPTYKKKQAEIKAQKIQKIAKRFREIPEEENILSRQRDIEFNKQIREKTEALKRGLPAKNVSLDIDSVAEKFRAVPEKTNIARETKEEKEKEEKFYQAYDYFKKIAYSMLSPAEEKYNFWGTTQYAVLDKPSEELVEEQVQNIVDYLENYYKDTNLLKQTDIKDRAISAYNKFKDLIPPQSVITDSDLDRAERYFEERGAGFLWSTSKEQIFKELLNNYLNNPFIIAINTGIRDPETRNRHLKYAVYKLAKNELF